jgi:surface antigen
MKRLLVLTCAVVISACPLVASAQYGTFEDAVITKFTKEDNELALKARNEALNSTDPKFNKEWNNEKSGHSGAVVVVETSEMNGKPCRTISAKSEVDGQVGLQKHQWCKMDDGSWKVPPGK